MSDPSSEDPPPSPEELARREEVRRKMRELLDKRNALPESERKPLSRPERFEDVPIGMDDQGNLYPDKAANPPAGAPARPKSRP